MAHLRSNGTAAPIYYEGQPAPPPTPAVDGDALAKQLINAINAFNFENARTLLNTPGINLNYIHKFMTNNSNPTPFLLACMLAIKHAGDETKFNPLKKIIALCIEKDPEVKNQKTYLSSDTKYQKTGAGLLVEYILSNQETEAKRTSKPFNAIWGLLRDVLDYSLEGSTPPTPEEEAEKAAAYEATGLGAFGLLPETDDIAPPAEDPTDREIRLHREKMNKIAFDNDMDIQHPDYDGYREDYVAPLRGGGKRSVKKMKRSKKRRSSKKQRKSRRKH